MSRITLQIDVRTKEIKDTLRKYAYTRGMTMSGMILSSVASQHPEIGKVIMENLLKDK